MLYNEERTAYHEAGHAFITVLNGREFESVTIQHGQFEDGTPYEGCTQLVKKYWAIPFEILYEAFIAYAGIAAEEIKFGAEQSESQEMDIIRTRRIIKEHLFYSKGDPANDEMVKSMWDNMVKPIVYTQLRGNWHAVEALAQALLEQKTLSGKAANKIMKAATQAYNKQKRATATDTIAAL